MEYSLTYRKSTAMPIYRVLILILMEYSLTYCSLLKTDNQKRLNPYSNGILPDPDCGFLA